MNNKPRAWIALGLITIIAAACLGVINEVTRDTIAEQTRTAITSAWRELLPGAHFPDIPEVGELPEEYVYSGIIDDEVVGYVSQVVVSGYANDVQVIVGTDPEGTIVGISVGGANFAETAGLGAKAKEPAFTEQFKGKIAPLVVHEDIDAITAATITSNAVVRGVNTAVESIAKVADFEIASTAEGGALGDGRYSATVRGFDGPIYVELLLDDAGVIQTIQIGDDSFSETPGFGTKALEPAFSDQFIGKSGHVELGTDIDVIAGATITSQAVVDAVNLALLYHSDPDAAAASGMPVEIELPEIPADALTESASAQGFAGPVEAQITVDAAGTTLLLVEFGGESWAETNGFGSRVLEPDFWFQFIGQPMPLDPAQIDVLTGATVTSKAAIVAVNEAYAKLFPTDEADTTEEVDTAEEPEPVVEPEADTAPEAPALGGTADASVKGFIGPIAVSITVEDGVLTAITIGDDDFAETEGFGTKVLAEDFHDLFIGKSLPLADGDIDVITGATISSQAVFAAVNEAYNKLLAQ